MLFICLIGYWYGVRAGIMTGLAYGILQFIQEPYVLSLFQVCCDYVLAFAGLGLAGLFSKSKNEMCIRDRPAAGRLISQFSSNPWRSPRSVFMS